MKISKISAYTLSSEVRESFGYYIVKVETDSGIYGLGESGIWYWGGSITKAVERLSEILIGEDPLSTEKLWQHMFRGSFFPADGVYSAAISAIDIALWDIKGKAFNMPVYKLLGGPVRDKVVCYPHNTGSTMEELIDSCLSSVEDGWKFVRWGQPETGGKFGFEGKESVLEPIESIDIAVEQIARVREAVGPNIQICFDVHTRLDTANVIQLCNKVEKYNPFFIEDPLRAESSYSYDTLSKHVDVPLAAGEQWSSKWMFREVIEKELISYARIDLCNVGGFTEALKIAHWAETHYIDVAPHNPLGPVSAAACVAFCMSLTNVGVQEMPHQPGTVDKSLFPVQIEWSKGYANCSDKPGLGIEMDEDIAEQRFVEPTGWPPLLKRNDGAFTNW